MDFLMINSIVNCRALEKEGQLACIDADQSSDRLAAHRTGGSINRARQK